MQQRHGQNKGTVKPVGHINMLDFAGGNGAEKYNRVNHPHHGNQNIDRPFQLGVFFTLGVAQRQRNRRQHNHQLPTPKSDGRQDIAAEKAHVTGALHHIIRGGKQAAAAKCENHRIGVQGAQAAEVKPRADIRQIKGRGKQLGGDNHADQHTHNTPNYSHDGELTHHLVVISLRFHEGLH